VGFDQQREGVTALPDAPAQAPVPDAPSFGALQQGAGNALTTVALTGMTVARQETAAPPAPPPPADGAAPPADAAAAAGDREKIEKALKDGDTDEMEEVWGGFGDNLPAVASANLDLWDRCRAEGADLEELPAVEKLRQKLRADVIRIAYNNLNRNEDLVAAEMERYGLSKERDVPQATSAKPIAADVIPKDKAREAQLPETKAAAKFLLALEHKQNGLRSVVVGKGAQPFDPGAKPVEDFDIGGKSSWEFVKAGWDQCEEMRARVLALNPALFAAMQSDDLLGFAEADPEQHPEAMQQRIRTHMMVVLNNIKVARGNIESGSCDYRSLSPILATLRGGAGGSTVPWNQPFYSWVMRNDVKDHEDTQWWVQLGLTAASMALLIAAEFATFGGATFLLLTGAGVGISAMQASQKQDQFNMLAAAQRAQVDPATGLVLKDQVDEAEREAFMAKLDVILNVGMTGFGAGMRALQAEKAAAGVAGHGAPARGPKVTAPDEIADVPTVTGDRPVPAVPGEVPVAAPGSPAAPTWTIDDVLAKARRTGEGSAAITLVKKHKIPIVTGPGNYAQFRASENTVFLGTDMSVDQASINFAHEINHAEKKILNIRPDPTKVSRQDFIAAKVAEEAEGQAKAIRHQFESQWLDPNFKGVAAGDKAYSDAFIEAVQRARAADPDAPEMLLKLRGQKAGEQALIKEFMEGRLATASSGGTVTYPEKFGSLWDRANGAAAAAP
jgi:hypothetical protein